MELNLKNLTSTYYSKVGYYNESKNYPYKVVVNELSDAEVISLKDIFSIKENKIEKLKGDGDFRPNECQELMKNSDVIVPNPPFSLFREYCYSINE